MPDCIFCQIVSKTAAAEIVYEDDRVVAFQSTYPVTEVHLLVVPKRHIGALDELSAAEADLAGHLLLTSRELGRNRSPEHGYRVSVNAGGQQDVDHLHFHVLGGQADLDVAAKGVNDE